MQPISYKVPTVTTDGNGNKETTYATDDSDWAEVSTGSENYETGTGQPMQGSVVKFKIRYRASLAITDKWKITYEGDDYKVNTIERVGLKKEYYLIKAKALR